MQNKNKPTNKQATNKQQRAAVSMRVASPEQLQKHAAIYVRTAVSQEPGEDKSLLQEEYCKRYCAEHGYAVHPGHIYREVGSGTQCDERLQLAVMRVAASQREFDVVVVYSYDRLSRKQVHLAALVSELEQCQVGILSVTESTDGLTLGQFVRSTYADLERKKILERMQHGKQLRKQQRRLAGE